MTIIFACRAGSTLLLPLALLFTGSLEARAQGSPTPAAVDRIFAEWDKPTSPGCALGVIQQGRLVYQRGYGAANLDYDIPNSPEMVYYIGSVSKQFTAAVVALLALEGRISLADDIRTYFPELPDYGEPITIRQLVHHTSGLRDIYVLMSLAGHRIEDVFTDEEALAMIARQRELNFAPGTDYLYSNSGYWLLGELVERVTGTPLRDYADEKLFQPLGMTRTHFHDDPGHVMKNRAMSYEPDGEGGFRISYLQNFDKIGAGGLYSTIGDLVRWDQNFYDPRVGGAPFLELMHTRGVLDGGDTLTYAFANNVGTFRGLRTVEHGGSLMGYKAYLLRFPDQRFTVALACNLGSINPGVLAQRVAELYLESRMQPEAEEEKRRADAPKPAGPSLAPTVAELRAYSGDYYSEELDATYTLSVEGSRLILRRRNSPALPLEPVSPGTFRAGRTTLSFEQHNGQPRAFGVEAGRVRNIRFERRSPGGEAEGMRRR